MQDTNRDGPSRWARYSKSASIWMIAIVLPLLVISMLKGSKDQPVELPYSEFNTQLTAGNIEDVTIIEGKKIEGTLRTPIVGPGKTYKQFKTLLPIKDSEKILDDL